MNALLETAIADYKPKAVIGLFSGGNDSTALIYATRPYLTHAAHIITGTGIPETTDFVRSVCQSLELELIVLETPPEVYEALVLDPESLRKVPRRAGQSLRKPGFPGPQQHQVAYYHLKQQRLAELRRRFSPRRGEKLLYVTGVRRAESTRRRNSKIAVPIRVQGSVVWVNPILDWTSRDLNAYRAMADVPRNPVADLIHFSGECLCGAMISHERLAEIELWYPDAGQRIRTLEARAAAAGVEKHRWGALSARPKNLPEAGALCSSCELRYEEAA